MANHSSFLDIAALLVADDAVIFVAGADLYRIPLLAGAMRALGTVPIDRRSGGGVHLALPETTVPDGLRLVVFPEGGISPAGQRRSFRRSAFALAIECGATVVPIAIHGSAAVMSRRDKLALRPGRITVEFLRAIPTDGMTMDDRHALTATAECRIYKALYPCDGGELLVTDRAA
ncbi:MAG TPA: lysophospholipid acyltransferase family protein [Acidimicrobiales bacterium]|nr:lysophospholipid acyltransferase family protein [Acidimicrobiales bacterium]